MKETIRAGLIYFDKPASLDNLDFDSLLLIRRAKEIGQGFEFGKYDRRDGTIEVIIERPDPPQPLKPGSQEEWDEKRAWYLEHARTDYRLFAQGMCEGWLTQDAQMTTGFTDDWAILEDWLGYIDSWKEEYPWWERLENQLEWEQRDSESKLERSQKMIELNSRRKCYVGLDERKITKKSLKFITQIANKAGIKIDLPGEALDHPWETYEKLKQIYATEVFNSEQYQTRIEELTRALNI